MLKFFIVILLSLLLLMCDHPTNQVEDSTGQVALNLVLRANSHKQNAMLTYVKSYEGNSPDNSFLSNVTPIDSAEFFINNKKLQNILFDSLSNNYHCYDNFPKIDKCYNYFSEDTTLINDGLNTLQIKIGDKNITGHTLMPSNFTLSLAHRKLSWSISTNASLYRVAARYKGDGFVQPFEKTTHNTEIILDINDFKAGEYKIIVEALDKNLVDFMLKKNNQAGLKNAYGVFGSVNKKEIIAYLQ